MTRLILVRHGQSRGNLELRLTGQTNSPLTPWGHEQARATADYLLANEKIDAVWCSDLLRAHQTASYYVKHTNHSVRYSKELREVDVGSWAGLSIDERNRLYPEETRIAREEPWRFAYPDGESIVDFYERAKRSILAVASAHDNETVAVFCHGGLIRQFQCFAEGYTPKDLNSIKGGSNCSISVYEVENGVVRPISYDYVGHLSTVTEADADNGQEGSPRT